MSVSEKLMQLGEWDIRLSPETPLSLRQAFAKWDTVIVTPSRVLSVEAMGSNDIKEVARYRGPLLELSDDRRTLRGAGMLYYLGNANGDGPWLEQWTVASKDWSEHLDVIEGQYALADLTRIAVVDEPATEWPPAGGDADELPHITRLRLEFLAEQLGCEYYITPTDDFHSGGAESNSLFTVTTPTVMLCRGQEGRDIDLIGLRIVDWNVTEDAWDSAGAVVVATGGGSYVASDITAVDTIWSPIGASTFHYGVADDTGEFSRYVEESSNTALTGMTDRATAIAQRITREKRSIAVSVDVYDPGRWMMPGDFIYAFDPVNEVYDDDNGTTYHGLHLHPAKLRLYGMRWPVRQGMGVYLLNGDHLGSYTGDLILDLTDYVEWEDGPCVLEVDAPRRSYDQ